jgi:large subunit ribosomal protein L9e
MRAAYAHFPINVIIAGDQRSVEIRNFLGEKVEECFHLCVYGGMTKLTMWAHRSFVTSTCLTVSPRSSPKPKRTRSSVNQTFSLLYIDLSELKFYFRLVEGNDIQNVSQSAASIHTSCLVKNKDIRKFLDGIYVSERTTVIKDDA